MKVTEEVQDYNDVQGLIQHAMDQDFNKANKVFGDVMTLKLQDMMDQEKIKIADQIYNGVEPDEEQLDLDLDDPLDDDDIEDDEDTEEDLDAEED